MVTDDASTPGAKEQPSAKLQLGSAPATAVTALPHCTPADALCSVMKALPREGAEQQAGDSDADEREAVQRMPAGAVSDDELRVPQTTSAATNKTPTNSATSSRTRGALLRCCSGAPAATVTTPRPPLPPSDDDESAPCTTMRASPPLGAPLSLRAPPPDAAPRGAEPLVPSCATSGAATAPPTPSSAFANTRA